MNRNPLSMSALYAALPYDLPKLSLRRKGQHMRLPFAARDLNRLKGKQWSALKQPHSRAAETRPQPIKQERQQSPHEQMRPRSIAQWERECLASTVRVRGVPCRDERSFKDTLYKNLRKKETLCVRGTDGMSDAVRRRFASLRKFVLVQQNDLARSFKRPVHGRTSDFALAYAERYLAVRILEGERQGVRNARDLYHCKYQSRQQRVGGGYESHSYQSDKENRSSEASPAYGWNPRRTELTLMAAVALWLATKVEEVTPPPIYQFLRLGATKFYAMEREMCRVTGWRFNPVVHSDFLSAYGVDESSGRRLTLGRYLLRRILPEASIMFQFPASLTALSLTVLERIYSGEDPRSERLGETIRFSGYREDQLIKSLTCIHEHIHSTVQDNSFEFDLLRDGDIKMNILATSKRFLGGTPLLKKQTAKLTPPPNRANPSSSFRASCKSRNSPVSRTT